MRHEATASAAVGALLTLVFGGVVNAQHHNKHDERALDEDPRLAPGQLAPVLEGRGEHHHPVTTGNERAQLFFDQGLKLTYGFNHQDALRSFKEAFSKALAHLERAVRLEDSLLYNEPPDWYYPVRHSLGAVLLEAGHPVEAEVVYWQDLKKNQENGYSLYGLWESLNAQGRLDEAGDVETRFRNAWKDADVKLTSSRF